MKLFRVSRPEGDKIDYDEFDSFVLSLIHI